MDIFDLRSKGTKLSERTYYYFIILTRKRPCICGSKAQDVIRKLRGTYIFLQQLKIILPLHPYLRMIRNHALKIFQ